LGYDSRVLTTVQADPYTIRGVSVGGVYTCLHVPELHALFDVGIAPRSFGAVDDLFLSHAHADHIGALTSLLGIRGLFGKGPLRVYMPKEIVGTVQAALAEMSKLQRYELEVEAFGLEPGQELAYRPGWWVRAFRTFHPVPSLGYQFVRKVSKLKPEFLGLPGPEIAARRKAGEPMTYTEERLELAYATDTLVRVLDDHPWLGDSRVLVLECSFLDERKDLASSRAGCHIHLDELIERAGAFRNEHLVLMHFSQIYRPDEVPQILEKRCPAELWQRIRPFAPKRKQWPG
jgi:ribonuclease Z